VTLVALDDLHEPPAITVAPGVADALELALGLVEPAEPDELGALVPQPARTATAAAPASSVMPRPR
jgi:hypothetical protein